MRLSFCAAVAFAINFTLIKPAYSGEWGLGIGAVNLGSEFMGIDSQTYILPVPSYHGDRLSIDLEGISYSLKQSEAIQIKAEVSGRFDGFDPKDSSELAGLKERKPGLDAGISITTQNAWGETKLSLLTDVSGISNGHELSLAYQYPVVRGLWVIAPGLGIKACSKKLVDYYYGVDSNEAKNGRPTYDGESAMDTYLSVSAGYQASKKTSFLLGIEHTWLDNAKKDSPIVDQNHKANVFVAFTYRLK